MYSATCPSCPSSTPPQSRDGPSESTTTARSTKSVLPAEVRNSGLTGSFMCPPRTRSSRATRSPSQAFLSSVALVEGGVDVELHRQPAPLAVDADAQPAPLELGCAQRVVAAVAHLPVVVRAEVGLQVALKLDLEAGGLVADRERLERPARRRRLLRPSRLRAADAALASASSTSASPRLLLTSRPRSRARALRARRGILNRPGRSSAIQSAPSGSSARPSWRSPGSLQLARDGPGRRHAAAAGPRCPRSPAGTRAARSRRPRSGPRRA